MRSQEAEIASDQHGGDQPTFAIGHTYVDVKSKVGKARRYHLLPTIVPILPQGKPSRQKRTITESVPR